MDLIIEGYEDVKVLRDDLLLGGTKSLILNSILDKDISEWVYASPVYGGLQIALSHWCKNNNKKATIFCAERGKLHSNTKECIDLGANVIQIPYGYLSNIQSKAKHYCLENGAKQIPFGFDTDTAKDIIANRMKAVINQLGKEPNEIWCVVGSGVLVEGIIRGTKKAKIFGVEVGKEYNIGMNRFLEGFNRLTLFKYHKPFDKNSDIIPPFKSTQNYDAKAWDYCLQKKGNGEVFFWNVY